jgi:hypothetical protein
MEFYKIVPTNHGWGWGYGFFSNYRVCLEQLIYHHESGDPKIPYIDWGGTTWVEGFNPFESEVLIPNGNPFDSWFEQQVPGEYDTVINCVKPSNPKTFNHAKHYFDDFDHLSKQQEIDRKYLKLRSHISNKIDEIYEKEFKDHTMLSVMARGTEYNLHHPMYGVFDINDYIREIRKVLEERPEITKLFIVSEDTDYIELLTKEFPNSYHVPGVFRRTDETMEYVNRVHCWPNVSTKRENHCKLLGEEVIIQAKLMGKCKYLFGRLSGVFTGAVLWNENLKEVIQI